MLTVRYNFVPVGQGLFSFGFLEAYGQRCSWVYDCGTTSSQGYVYDGIDHLSEQVAGDRIEIVAISHFDQDHVSGMVKILSQFRVRRLVLPYVPLFRRLEIAFSEQAGLSGELMSFARNPVSFIASIDGVDVEEIVFVLSNGGTPPPDEATVTEPATPQDRAPTVEIAPPARGANDAEREDLGLGDISNAPRVVFMPPGAGLQFLHCWEFVPYNDAELLPRASEQFCNAVEAVRRDLLAAPSKQVLSELRIIYADTFGNTSDDRNVISLFLYGGPIGASAYQMTRINYYPGPPCHNRIYDYRRDSGAIMYTGDGYLNTNERIAELKEYYGEDRMQNIFCFQVMHHGAEGNWRAGLAGELAPTISVFSSDPAHRRFGHPHRAVLFDFTPYQPFQVDKRSGIMLTAWFALDEER